MSPWTGSTEPGEGSTSLRNRGFKGTVERPEEKKDWKLLWRMEWGRREAKSRSN